MAGGLERKTYFIIFGWLTALTVLEVGLVYMPVSRTPMIVGLIGLALAKAALVALFFMHLKYETPVLRKTVMLPFCVTALYACVFILESAWRMGT